jgi:hypothetical protein
MGVQRTKKNTPKTLLQEITRRETKRPTADSLSQSQSSGCDKMGEQNFKGVSFVFSNVFRFVTQM